MIHRSARMLAAALALASLASCAAGGYVAQTPQMPAARAALRPEYRIFYDALQDYGDWVLIEPYGFVFHPRVDFATFRPYQDGFWAPTDAWGWVWISAEPFGWATYHYGTWLWDRYQGWVWMPGTDWGPAWVSWQISAGWAGWAPMQPGGGSDRGYLYAPLDHMGSTDLGSYVMTETTIGTQLGDVQSANNPEEREGLRFNRGPAFARIERARGGQLQRVKLEETTLAGRSGRRDAGAPGTPTVVDLEGAKREAEDLAQQTRSLIDAKSQAPALLPLLRRGHFAAAADSSARRAARRARAAADTTR